MSNAATARAAAPAGEVDIGRLADYLGNRVRLAHVAMQRRWEVELAACDITQKQYAVLYLIQQNPGCSQVAVGAALETDAATLMTIVAKLEGRGLVSRRRSKADARRLELLLTAAGESLMTEATPIIEAHEKRHEDLLRGRELSELMRMLDALIAGP